MAQRRPIFRDAATGKPTELNVPIDDTTPSHNGELLIWDSVAQAYVPGDPLVQGLYAEGTTTIPNPVIVGGKDYSGTPALQTLKVDSNGQVYIGNFPATQPVSGTVAVSSVGGTVAVTGPLTDTQLRATPVPVSGTVAATQSGTWNIGTVATITNPVAVTGTFWQATQPVSIASAVTVAQATAANLNATVVFGSPQHVIVDSASLGTVTVSGSVNATLGAETTKVIGTVRLLGNAGATMDSTIGAGTAPTNALMVGGQFRTSLQTLTNLQTSAIALDAKAQPLVDLNYVAGSAVSVSATGVLKVGVVGGAGGATVDATVGAGTAPTNMIVTGAVYNSTLPTLSTGQSAAIQVDAKGQPLVDLNYVAGSPVATAAAGIPKVGITDGSGNAITSTGTALDINIKTSALTDPAEVAQGTSPSTKVMMMGGKSNDATPQYREIPLGLGARSVIVEGYSGGTGIPITIPAAQVSAGNSSTATLTANSVFTGASVDLTSIPTASISVTSFSDQASAANGLAIQWSSDNTNWDRYTAVTALANQAARITVGIRARYMRVVYTNGTVNQTVFRLQTVLSPMSSSPTFKTVDTTVAGTDNAQAVKAVNIGKNPQGTYIPQATDVYGNMGVFFSGGAADAFGRARVSSPQTLFNVSFEYDMQPLLMQTVTVGTGAATKTTNQSSVTLTTGGTTSTNGVDFQSKGYYRYEPGKSLLILMTGVVGAAKANVRSRIGFFDANNGVFFDQNNGIGVTIRTNTSGSPVDTTVLQANWNVDKMDGTGPSGITLDFSKSQIFVIDLQWLGTGTIRFGFEVNGQLFICHKVNNANIISGMPYMNTACLPVHWSIYNTGTAASSTSMVAVCCAVVSEGGADRPSAYQFSAGNPVSSLQTVGTTRVPIMAIRPKTTFNSLPNRSVIKIDSIAILDNGGQPMNWELVYNPTLTGASFADVNTTYSAVQVDTTATALTGGLTIASGYVQGGSHAETQVSLAHLKIPLTLDAAGTVQDIFCLVGTAPGNTTIAATMTWTEER